MKTIMKIIDIVPTINYLRFIYLYEHVNKFYVRVSVFVLEIQK